MWSMWQGCTSTPQRRTQLTNLRAPQRVEEKVTAEMCARFPWGSWCGSCFSAVRFDTTGFSVPFCFTRLFLNYNRRGVHNEQWSPRYGRDGPRLVWLQSGELLPIPTCCLSTNITRQVVFWWSHYYVYKISRRQQSVSTERRFMNTTVFCCILRCNCLLLWNVTPGSCQVYDALALRVAIAQYLIGRRIWKYEKCWLQYTD